jgi:hypothetical protein
MEGGQLEWRKEEEKKLGSSNEPIRSLSKVRQIRLSCRTQLAVRIMYP